MSIDVLVETCLTNAEQVRIPGVLEPFLHALAGLGDGFFLSDFYAEQGMRDWYRTIISLEPADADTIPVDRQREVSTAGLSPILRESLGRFARHEQEDLVINAFSVAREGPFRGMRYLLSVLNHEDAFHDDGSEYVRVSTLRIDAGKNALNSDDEVYLLKSMPHRIYEAWHPLMTYLTYGDVPTTSSEEAAAGRITYLYAVNVYSPQVVQHLGRDRLLATPGASIETLGDSGIELRPQDMQSAAAHLGLRWTVM